MYINYLYDNLICNIIQKICFKMNVPLYKNIIDEFKRL